MVAAAIGSRVVTAWIMSSNLGKGEPVGYRLVHDAGRGLWIERVVVDAQVDLVDLASQLLQHTDDVALWPALLPGDGMNGGVLQPAGLCWRGEAAHTSHHDQLFWYWRAAAQRCPTFPIAVAGDNGQRHTGEKPLADDTGVLRSACASIQTMPRRPPRSGEHCCFCNGQGPGGRPQRSGHRPDNERTPRPCLEVTFPLASS
jgi:hypothetical protein